MDGKALKRRILEDLRVELTDEFDRNFERKAFFSEKWKPRKMGKHGTLLNVTGTLRRSIQSRVTGSGVEFTSQVPYAAMHNEGFSGTVHVPAHVRKLKNGKTVKVRDYTQRVNMPQRQFIGRSPEVDQIVRDVVTDAVQDFANDLAKNLRKG